MSKNQKKHQKPSKYQSSKKRSKSASSHAKTSKNQSSKKRSKSASSRAKTSKNTLAANALKEAHKIVSDYRVRLYDAIDEMGNVLEYYLDHLDLPMEPDTELFSRTDEGRNSRWDLLIELRNLIGAVLHASGRCQERITR